jgi:hypothetical protein
MFIPSVITMLCVGGVTFYMRLLVALCKEWKPRPRRAHKESRLLQKMPKVDRQSSKFHPSLAALKISDIHLNIDSHEFRRHQA